MLQAISLNLIVWLCLSRAFTDTLRLLHEKLGDRHQILSPSSSRFRKPLGPRIKRSSGCRSQESAMGQGQSTQAPNRSMLSGLDV